MKMIALVFTLIFSIWTFMSSEEITPILIVVEDSIVKMGEIDENTGLLWAKFINKQDNSEVAGIYIFSKSGKYKFVALYLNFETDKETFVLYSENGSEVIGPIGLGAVKDNYVSWVYDTEIQPSPAIITFKHYKDFNIKTKEGILVAEYEVNLVELAKKLYQKSPPMK